MRRLALLVLLASCALDEEEAPDTAQGEAPIAQFDLADVPIGLYDQVHSVVRLQNDLPGGPDPIQFTYGAATPTKFPVAGDWDGNGTDTIGLYQQFPGGGQPSSTFFLRNSNSSGYADVTLSVETARCGWLCQPVAGKWSLNRFSFATPGVYDNRSGTFYLRTSNDPADIEILNVLFRPAGWRSTWLPLAGDHDGDGFDNVALYDPATGTVYVANPDGSATAATISIRPPGWSSTWQPLFGKFDVSSTAIPALYDRSRGELHLGSTPPVTVRFGSSSWGVPFTGNWSRAPLVPSGTSVFMTDAEYDATSWIALMGGLHDEPGSTADQVSAMWRAGNLHSLNEILDAYDVERNAGALRVAVFMGTNVITNSCDWTSQTAFCLDHLQKRPIGQYALRVFDPTSLQRQLDLYLDFRREYPLRPVQLFLHIGAYRGDGPTADYFADLDADGDGYAENAMRDQCDRTYEQEVGWYPRPFRHVSFSPLATEVQSIRRRNLQQATGFALRYLRDHNALGDLIGIDTESEAGYGSMYEPYAIKDFGEHDVEGFRQRLQAKYGTIGAVNARFGTSFPSFPALQPPRCWPAPGAGQCWRCDGSGTYTRAGDWDVLAAPNPYFAEWSAYRHEVLDGYVETSVATVRGIWEAFITANKLPRVDTRKRVHSHQGAGYDFYSGGSDQVTRTANGTVGVTVYDDLADGEVHDRMLAYRTTDPGWMVGEFNTGSNDPAANQAALRFLLDQGAKVISLSGYNLVIWGDYPQPGSVQVVCFEGTNPWATTYRFCLPDQEGLWLHIPGTVLDWAVKQLLAPY